MSRDDSGSFLPHYAELEIVKKNPFATIDQTGVGQLVEIAVTKGRSDAPERSSSASAASTAAIRRRFTSSRRSASTTSALAVPRAGRPPRRRAGGASGKSQVGQRAEGIGLRGGYRARSCFAVFCLSCPCLPFALCPVMNTIFVHRDGRTEPVTSIDRSWLGPAPAGKPLYLWVDLAAPSIPESLVLTDSFAFHPLAVEDARTERQLPTIDAFDGYLFAVVAGADADISVFVGPHYIVTRPPAPSRRRSPTRLTASGTGAGSSARARSRCSTGWSTRPSTGWRRLFRCSAPASTASRNGCSRRRPPDVVREVLRARSDAFGLGQRLAERAGGHGAPGAPRDRGNQRSRWRSASATSSITSPGWPATCWESSTG